MRRHGGYATRVRGNVRFVFPIPDALESENAAPLLCGGITVYNPLRSHGVNPSSRVGVIGIGGLGHMAIQFARVFGAEVTAFSTSAAKETEARADGRASFCEYPGDTGTEGSCRLAGFHSQHGECRSGLGRVYPGPAAYRHAVLCGRSAVAGFAAGFPADLRYSHRSPAVRSAAHL